MSRLTHIADDGAAHMVDVGGKAETHRVAIASGLITMSKDALEAIRHGDAPKGDVLGTARVAGILAAKRTGELIPLCHPLGLEAVTVDFTFEDAGVSVTASASLTGKTGVEMEALTAASVAALTVYDMCKAIDRAMVIESVQLMQKTGGQRGEFVREPDAQRSGGAT